MPEMWDLELRGVTSQGERDGAHDLVFETNDGVIRARHHAGAEDGPAILWVFGAGGGFGGPAGGVYERLAGRLTPHFFASLQVDYRYPVDLNACTLDVLAGIECLASVGHTHIVLVGHSFGGAVVINAAAMSEKVIGVAALSPQLFGSDRVGEISPRPLLLIHGGADEVLPDSCSRTLKQRSGDPVELKIYPNCRHGLDDCREQLDRDLTDWLMQFVNV